MSDRTFRTALALTLGVCAVLTLAHFVYIVYAYRRCSILYFIGKELW